MSRFSLVFLFLILSFPSVVISQTQPSQSTVLADINLSNAKILSRDNRGIIVAVDIDNRSASTQNDIRYGIEFIRTTDKGQEVVDSYIAQETLSLAGNQSAHREISYTIPKTLSGDFDVWTIARTQGGLMLGLNNAGKVTSIVSGDHAAIIPDSCRLNVSGDSKSYTLLEGVDVSKDETLTLTCSVQNDSKTALTLVPYLDTYRRSVYGDKMDVSHPTQADIVFAPDEKKEISITIPQASDPQAYDATVLLVKKDGGVPVSEKILLHYVLRGESATVQNVVFDRMSYSKGETITVSVFVTPSADGFQGSRSGQGTEVSGLAAILAVTDSGGRACIEPMTKPVVSDGNGTVFTAPALIDCDQPTSSLSVVDGDGRLLYGKPLPQNVVVDQANEQQPVQRTVSQEVILFVLIALLSVFSFGSIVFWYVLKKKGVRGAVVKSILLPVALFGTMLVGGKKVEAVTWDNNHLAQYPFPFGAFEFVTSYTANVNKYSFVSGEPIVLSGFAGWGNCNNSGIQVLTVLASFSEYPGSTTVVSPQIIVTSSPPVYGIGTLIAPTVSSPKTVRIALVGKDLFAEKAFFGNAYIDVIVTPLCAPSCPTTCGGGESDGCGGTCAARSVCPACIGTITTNASIFANDNVDLAADTPYSYWPTDTGTRCQYHCDSGYNWDVATSTCNLPTPGSCGSAAGRSFASSDFPPGSYALCSVGMSSSIRGTGDWAWDCSGSYSGVPASCLATCQVNCHEDLHCSTETSWDVKNDCGNMHTCSGPGTRACNLNWREVPPGL